MIMPLASQSQLRTSRRGLDIALSDTIDVTHSKASNEMASRL
jgi:hypothetical protein